MMTERARALRRASTSAKLALWHIVSRYRPAFTRELVVDDRYIVDLANRTARLPVELDGSQNIEPSAHHSARTPYLELQGWRVIRLWSSDMLSNPQGAAEYVLSQTAECLGGTHPNPSLPGRGDQENLDTNEGYPRAGIPSPRCTAGLSSPRASHAPTFGKSLNPTRSPTP